MNAQGGRRGLAVAAALLLAGVLAALAATPLARRLESELGGQSVPAPAESWSRLQTLLRKLGRLELQPPTALLAGGGQLDASGCPDARMAVHPVPREAAPSSRLAPRDWIDRGIPLLSLYLEPCRRRRIEGHPMGFGRAWEEPGWVSFYDRGALRFVSAVGVRLHGGADRKRSWKSYRLHFRPRYGAAGWPGEQLSADLDRPVARLVIDADRTQTRGNRTWYFLGALAYDVARRLGAETPAARPAAVSVNGERPQPYLLVERPDGDYLERHFGHRDFELVRTKWNPGEGEPAAAQRLRRFVVRAPAPLLRAVAATRFDLEALTDGFAAALYCATGEAFQSVLVRDRRGVLAGGRWSWIVWDYDSSFVDRRGFTRFGRARDLLPYVLRGSRLPYVNHILLHRLLDEDAGYRRELAARVVRALNHELTAEFLARRLEGYERSARELGVEDLEFLARLRAFTAERPAALYRQLETYLDVGAPRTVEVSAPVDSVRVDGETLAGRYRGRYPAGLTVSVEVEPAARARFAGWRIDGVELASSPLRLELEVDRPLRIEARFTG